MKILVLGGDGMFSHQFFKHMRERHDVRVTLRQDLKTYERFELFDHHNAYAGIDVRSTDRLLEVLADFRPDVVVNGVGIVKQRPSAYESIPSLEINALLPHRLAHFTKAVGARLIHLSTDCVFSGRRGNYKESETADAEDLYGRSKYLGEVGFEPHCLTLRTSIIGRELSRKTGLLEWALAQEGPVRGFRNAVFSGFTTLELSRVVEMLLTQYPDAGGIYQASSEPIDKYTLLHLFKAHFNLPIDILEDFDVRIDRSLDSSRFREHFNYQPPSWNHMIAELVS